VVLPTICVSRVGAERGCLIANGPSLPTLYKRIADYVIRIFRGADPGVLPIEGPENSAGGLIIPPAIHSRADEVIEQA
jgi:putative tryptophan/tyrosine transport system substrate-binding protein